MSSDLAKMGLVSFFDGEGIPTKASDWKRTAKLKVRDGGYGERNAHYVRRFENAKVGLTAFVYDGDLEEYEGEGDYLYCHEAGDLYVSVIEVEENESTDGERFSLMFVSKTQWAREGYFPDQHWGHVLMTGYGIPADLIGDEVSENTFVPAQQYQDGTKEDLIAALDAIPGITHDPKLDNHFLSEG